MLRCRVIALLRTGALLWIAAASFPVLAGDASGKVVSVGALNGDVAIFDVGSRANKPACSTQDNQWAISLSTHTGRAMYASLLYAQATGRTVTVHGTGQCTAWADRENAFYIWVGGQ